MVSDLAIPKLLAGVEYFDPAAAELHLYPTHLPLQPQNPSPGPGLHLNKAHKQSTKTDIIWPALTYQISYLCALTYQISYLCVLIPSVVTIGP